jgi:hypothetical protein
MNKRDSAARPGKFIVSQIHKGCWIVGCNGRWIAGAVLSSLPAAAAYAADIAAASGWKSYLLTVVAAGRHAV